MSYEDKVFEMMKAIAPVFVQQGFNLQERIIASGSNPADCTVGGKSIMESYAESAKEWAEALVKAL